MRKAVFLSIDGLGTNLVGAYGNSICPTPNMDFLASKSLVLDQFWSDSPRCHAALGSVWSGRHQLSSGAEEFSLWQEQIRQGLLVTDDASLVDDPAASVFDRVLLVEGGRESDEESDVTEFQNLVEAALGEWLDSIHNYSFLWIHSRGLKGDWDAPYEYRRVMCDEGDPEPPSGREPISFEVSAATDPDEVFKVSCALGGQIVVIDQAIGQLLGTLREIGVEDETIVGLIGLSGYPLGEHGQVGGEPSQLYAERLHSPCMIRFGAALPLGCRHSTILQPHELGAWIDWWFRDGLEEESPDGTTFDLASKIESMLDEALDTSSRVGAAIAREDEEFFVATPAWSCRIPRSTGSSHQPALELFAKPDDRWEQNEVSQRAIHVAEKMLALKEKLVAAYSSGLDGEPVNWLDDELVRPIR